MNFGVANSWNKTKINPILISMSLKNRDVGAGKKDNYVPLK